MDEFSIIVAIIVTTNNETITSQICIK